MLGLLLLFRRHLPGVQNIENVLPGLRLLDRFDLKGQAFEIDAALLGVGIVAIHAIGIQEGRMLFGEFDFWFGDGCSRHLGFVFLPATGQQGDAANGNQSKE